MPSPVTHQPSSSGRGFSTTRQSALIPPPTLKTPPRLADVSAKFRAGLQASPKPQTGARLPSLATTSLPIKRQRWETHEKELNACHSRIMSSLSKMSTDIRQDRERLKGLRDSYAAVKASSFETKICLDVDQKDAKMVKKRKKKSTTPSESDKRRCD